MVQNIISRSSIPHVVKQKTSVALARRKHKKTTGVSHPKHKRAFRIGIAHFLRSAALFAIFAVLSLLAVYAGETPYDRLLFGWQKVEPADAVVRIPWSISVQFLESRIL